MVFPQKKIEKKSGKTVCPGQIKHIDTFYVCVRVCVCSNGSLWESVWTASDRYISRGSLDCFRLTPQTKQSGLLPTDTLAEAVWTASDRHPKRSSLDCFPQRPVGTHTHTHTHIKRVDMLYLPWTNSLPGFFFNFFLGKNHRLYRSHRCRVSSRLKNHTETQHGLL